MFAPDSHQRRGTGAVPMRDRAHVHRVADYAGADAAEREAHVAEIIGDATGT